MSSYEKSFWIVAEVPVLVLCCNSLLNPFLSLKTFFLPSVTSFEPLTSISSHLLHAIHPSIYPSLCFILEGAWLTNFPTPVTLSHCWLKTHSRCCVNAQIQTCSLAHADEYIWQHMHTKGTLKHTTSAHCSNFRNRMGTHMWRRETSTNSEKENSLKVHLLLMPDRTKLAENAHICMVFPRFSKCLGAARIQYGSQYIVRDLAQKQCIAIFVTIWYSMIQSQFDLIQLIFDSILLLFQLYNLKCLNFSVEELNPFTQVLYLSTVLVIFPLNSTSDPPCRPSFKPPREVLSEERQVGPTV